MKTPVLVSKCQCREARAGLHAPWPRQLESKPQRPLLDLGEQHSTSLTGCGPPFLLCSLTTLGFSKPLLEVSPFPSPGLALPRIKLVGRGAVVQTTCYLRHITQAPSFLGCQMATLISALPTLTGCPQLQRAPFTV